MDGEDHSKRWSDMFSSEESGIEPDSYKPPTGHAERCADLLPDWLPEKSAAAFHNRLPSSAELEGAMTMLPASPSFADETQGAMTMLPVSSSFAQSHAHDKRSIVGVQAMSKRHTGSPPDISTAGFSPDLQWRWFS